MAMLAHEIIDHLRGRGVVLAARGDKLRFHPAHAVGEQLRATLETHKREILAELRRRTLAKLESDIQAELQREALAVESSPVAPVNGGDLTRTAQPVCRCGSSTWRDTLIHAGQSSRRDCAECWRFVGFPVWYGEPLHLPRAGGKRKTNGTFAGCCGPWGTQRPPPVAPAPLRKEDHGDD